MWLVLTGSGVVGFVFFLMELVWYRMLAPILGGTVFMFGVILAVALFGIGLGGLVYAALAPKRVSLGAFALTCLLEAAFVAFPYALGDRVATLALLLRPLGSLGFGGFVLVTLSSPGCLSAEVLSAVGFSRDHGLLGQARRWGQTGSPMQPTGGRRLPARWRRIRHFAALSVPVLANRGVELAGLGFVATLFGSCAVRPLGFLFRRRRLYRGGLADWRDADIGVGAQPMRREQHDQVTPSPNIFVLLQPSGAPSMGRPDWRREHGRAQR